VSGLSTKLYLTALSLPATPDPKVIFIILIIILNLHDSSLSEFGCNIKPEALDMSLVARSCYKNAIIRKEKI
jgi:p-aminobenzoyl-glutamate transporter AbgT